MTRLQILESRRSLKDARDDWNHGKSDDALDKILNVVDLLLNEHERAERMAARENQIEEARACHQQ